MTADEFLYLIKTHGISLNTGRVANLWDASVMRRFPNGITKTDNVVGITPEDAIEKLARRCGWLAPPADLPLFEPADAVPV